MRTPPRSRRGLRRRLGRAGGSAGLATHDQHQGAHCAPRRLPCDQVDVLPQEVGSLRLPPKHPRHSTHSTDVACLRDRGERRPSLPGSCFSSVVMNFFKRRSQTIGRWRVRTRFGVRPPPGALRERRNSVSVYVTQQLSTWRSASAAARMPVTADIAKLPLPLSDKTKSPRTHACIVANILGMNPTRWRSMSSEARC